MSAAQTLVLGAIAGLTIFIGLPIGRSRSLSPQMRVFLNAVTIGILVFLLWDVLGEANGTVEDALVSANDHGGSWLRFLGYSATFAGCFAIGLLSLVYYERWLGRDKPEPSFGPGAAAVEEFTATHAFAFDAARRLALYIALGIGLHNFSEGLAIGQSAANDQISLALALIIGFALHNSTEGFGIVAPLAAEHSMPSWGFLAALGLIGGGPTFIGTVIGRAFINEALFVAFLALAAGSIVYVVMQLVKVGNRLGHAEYLAWGVLLGVVAGFATDYVLVAAGA